MPRKASQRDIEVYDYILTRLDALTYKEAVEEAATTFGLTPKGVYGMAHRAKNQPKQAAPPVAYLPEGHSIKAVSTLFDENGAVRGQWVKTNADKDNWNEWINVALDRIEDIKPYERSLEATPRVEDTWKSRLTVFPVADLHLGLYASALETGKDWTLNDAVDAYRWAFRQLITSCAHADTAIIANIGDFTHIDNLINRTPRSGAAMDASGRYHEIVEAAMDTAIYIIDQARAVFRTVKVIWQSGNHDEATAIVMQAALKRLYSLNESVEIIESHSRFHVLQHHAIALGFTHGDTVKPQELPLLMATDYPAIWGATRFRVWHTGHVHHKTVQEFPGCIVETHGAPVPKDNWHYEQGYRSQRGVQSITYDLTGETGRSYIRL